MDAKTSEFFDQYWPWIVGVLVGLVILYYFYSGSSGSSGSSGTSSSGSGTSAQALQAYAQAELQASAQAQAAQQAQQAQQDSYNLQQSALNTQAQATAEQYYSQNLLANISGVSSIFSTFGQAQAQDYSTTAGLQSSALGAITNIQNGYFLSSASVADKALQGAAQSQIASLMALGQGNSALAQSIANMGAETSQIMGLSNATTISNNQTAAANANSLYGTAATVGTVALMAM
jgi:hypothetical protein